MGSIERGRARARSRWLGGLALCAFCAAASTARAIETPSAELVAPSEARVIEITVVGTPAAFASVRSAVAPDAFAGATLRWQRSARLRAADLLPKAAPRAEVVIRSFVDLSDGAHARLYFSDRDAERFLLRDLELNGGLDELDREALSQAIELSVRALLDDRSSGISREEARSIILPRVEPTPEPIASSPAPAETPTRSAARRGLAAGAFWGAEAHSSELGWTHGPGLSVAYELAFGRARGAAWASGQYRFERDHRAELVGVAISSIALRAGIDGVRQLGSGGAFGGVRLGGGVDLVRFTPAAGSGERAAVLEPAGSSSEVVLSPGLLLGSELHPRLTLTLALFVDLALNRAHYDLEIDGGTARVVNPWLARPALALGVSLH